MVYTGKPSRGCQLCKTRRIKCDEARPTCGNCAKSGRDCPGYPDEFDLIFRNETKAVKRRADKASSKKGKGPDGAPRASPRTVSESSQSPKSLDGGQLSPEVKADDVMILTHDDDVDANSPTGARAVSTLFQRAASDPKFPFLNLALAAKNSWLGSLAAVPPGLEVSTEAAATAFFFRNFVTIPQQNGCSRGYLEYLIPVYNRASADSAIQAATHAVSLSALSNYPGNSRLKLEAKRAYGEALRKVNEAITAGPKAASSNEILLTVLMFSLYETVDSANFKDTAWTHHIDGAVALAKHRIDEGWEDEESIGIFRAIRTSMLTSAIQRAEPMPDFPGNKGWNWDDAHELNPANRLALISLGIPNMRRFAIELTPQEPGPEKDAALMQLIHMAQEADAALEHWYQSVPDNWAYHTVSYVQEEPKDLHRAHYWRGPVHVYGDLFIANIVNDYRVSRIFCQQLISNALESLWDTSAEKDIRSLMDHSNYVTCSMADDICSSVPFHLEIKLQPGAGNTGQEAHAAEATGGFFLTWALYVVGNLDCIPANQREWARRRLFRIGVNFGLSQGQILQIAQRQVLSSGPSVP